MNMDPLGMYPDHEIWEAPEQCQLKAIVSSLLKLLDSSDEATASIDSATDAILHNTIRKEFLGCTVAHRVPTITDSDMVMVLSDGMFSFTTCV
ncbi:hypothetical protein Dsin_014142 [Dipteronia sinensis]|uniref:Uncharacterized protein n=1 Tax=Dipteronia sinensis TaxID=43782 RepID=A0AAE0ALN6_9ROSI|nr:hypothetical protein Dsin_014142 [Dipteronia sinensis]